LRKLRIAAPVQLPLDLGGALSSPVHRWLLLPEPARQQVLALLARLIARGVVAEEEGVER
jgi:hypothetical protein